MSILREIKIVGIIKKHKCDTFITTYNAHIIQTRIRKKYFPLSNLVSFVSNATSSNVLITVDRVNITGNTAFANSISAPQGTFNTIIGNTSLAIGSNVNISTSSVSVGNSTVNTYFTISALSTNGSLGVYRAATLANTLSTTGNVTFSNTLAVTGNATLSNTLAVTGNATFSNTILITGNSTLSNTLSVTGNATLSNTLAVTGNSTFSNSVIVSGNVSLSNTLSVTGNVILSNTLAVTGNVAFSNTLAVIGNVTISNITTLQSTLNVTGAATLSNTLAVTGNVTLSNTTTLNDIRFSVDSSSTVGNTTHRPLKIWSDNVETTDLTVTGLITGTFNTDGNIIPNSNTTNDLGSAAKWFDEIYVQSITTNSISVSGANSNFNSGLLFIDNTNSRIGIKTSSPSSTFTANGVIETNDSFKLPDGSIISSSSNTTVGLGQQAVDTFSTSTYRSADYVISIKDNNANGYQITKILIVHDGGTSYATEYGTMATNTSLGIFSTDINGGNVRLLVTPTSSSTTMKISRTTLVV